MQGRHHPNGQEVRVPLHPQPIRAGTGSSVIAGRPRWYDQKPLYLSGAFGGGGGIRTRERLASLPVFKTGAFDHSATSPLWLAMQRLDALFEGVIQGEMGGGGEC